jgi:tetratricopeptide (TPR) repeat protein
MRRWLETLWKQLTALWHGIYPTSLWDFLLLGVLVGVVYVLIKWAYFTPPQIIIEDVLIPKKLSESGYSGHLLAARIADEIRNIQRVGRTTKAPINTEVSELKPDVEVRATVFTLGSIISFVRPLFGNADHIVSSSLYCGDGNKLWLSLQGSYSHRGPLPDDVAHVHILRTAITVTDISVCDNPEYTDPPTSGNTDICGANGGNQSAMHTRFDELPKWAAQAIIRTFDPFFLAVYHFERARYYEGKRLLVDDGLLSNVDRGDITKKRNSEIDCGMRAIKYSLGIDTSGNVDEADERVPYDKSTRARALNLWAMFYLVNTNDPNFEQAEEKLSEAIRTISDDANLTREMAFVHDNLGDTIFASAIWHLRLGVVATDLNVEAELAKEQYRQAIRDGEEKDGYGSWGVLLLDEAWLLTTQPQLRDRVRLEPDEAYRLARSKFRASVENSHGQPFVEAYKGWGDAIWKGRELFSSSVPENKEIEQAINIYRKAIATDSTWAPAHVKLSFALISQALQKLSSRSMKSKEIEKAWQQLIEGYNLYCRAIFLYKNFPDQYRKLVFVPEQKEEFVKLRSQLADTIECKNGELAPSLGE